MDKSKAIRNIIIYIVILMTCMFFVGFFTAKKAYASEGDDIYAHVPAPPLESNETYFLREHISSNSNLEACIFDINGNILNLNVPIYYRSYNGMIQIYGAKVYEWSGTNWVYKETHNTIYGFSIEYSTKYVNFDMLSVPIYYADEINGELVLTNEVFFFPESHLSRLMARIPMTEIMREILSVMTISLGLVVSFLALRKALAWLLKILRTA